MAMGKTNAEIGGILGLSPLTVKNHVQTILLIYGSQNRICAVMRALSRGDVSLGELMKQFS
jgi:DNA-binding CsgD family transcriptional regulator